MRSIRFGYLPTEHLCVFGDDVYRREKHFTDDGEVFVAVDIISGSISGAIDNQTRVRMLTKDHLERLISRHIVKQPRRRCTRRQFVYVDTRVKHPELGMSECARRAGYSSRVSRNAEKIERRCKKIFSAYIFIRDKMYALYGLDETTTDDDDIRVS